MTRHVPLTIAFILLITGVEVTASVHVRRSDGAWIELQATEQDGTVNFVVTPDDTDAGQALLVINKPAWLVLEDETPPIIVRYSIAGETVEPGLTDEPAPIEGFGDTADLGEVTFTIVDDANPIDVANARLCFAGLPARPFDIVDEDTAARTASLRFDLKNFNPGVWRGTLEVADLSPMRNTLRVPIEFSIAGVQVADNQQTITLSTGGALFTARGDKRETITVDAAGVSAFLSLQPEGEKHLYVREFARVEDLGVRGDWRLVAAEAALEDIDGKAVEDDEVGTHLKLRFAVHRDIPAVVVTAAATNLAAARTMYAFWGWLPGDGYVTSDGQTHEWLGSYAEVQSDTWILLPSKDINRPGVGWVSTGDFGESRFGTMLLYTNPQKPQVATGETLISTFALMPAVDSEEVAEIARRLIEEGALELAM